MRVGPIQLLVAANVLLAGGLAWLWLDEHGQWRNISWTAPVALLPELNGLSTAGVPPGPQAVNPTQYLAILERPIFAPDRRPPPPPAPPPPPDPMADVQITGIFSGEHGGVLARVEGKVRRVKINESIGAWSLKSISGRDVTFVQGEQTRQLRLDYTRWGVAPTQSNAQVGVVRSTGGGTPSSSLANTQALQDEVRDRLRRRNEIRAARGLPPVTD